MILSQSKKALKSNGPDPVCVNVCEVLISPDATLALSRSLASIIQHDADHSINANAIHSPADAKVSARL